MNWAALLSARVLFGALLVAVLLAFVPTVISPILGGVVFWGAFIWVVGYQVVNGTRPWCPNCRKRIKIGAHGCSHCGWVR